MSALHGLDGLCPTCKRVAGDHTLREWSDCIGAPTTDLPFEEIPEDAAALAAANLRAVFDLDPDLIVADHFIAKAITLTAGGRGVEVVLPGVMHEFMVGVPGEAPVVVAKVVYVGNVKGVRAYGWLLRDTSSAAANVAERRG